MNEVIAKITYKTTKFNTSSKIFNTSYEKSAIWGMIWPTAVINKIAV